MPSQTDNVLRARRSARGTGDEMTHELRATGPHRALLLAALKVYSDDCQHPQLSPDCPFSVEVQPGVRDCDEQCAVLLREQGVPVGDEPFPPRRTLSKRPGTGASGDLRQRYLIDRGGRHVRRWALTSLVTHLVMELVSAPITASEDPGLYRRVIKELRARGVDVDALLRLGVGLVLAPVITMGLVVPAIWPDDEPFPTAIPPAGWADVLDAVLADTPPPDAPGDDAHRRFIAALSSDFPRVAIEWAATATLDDLLAWQPPTLAALAAIREACQSDRMATGTDRVVQGWLLDRWTQSYFDDWRSESLRLEYKWALGEEPSPCDDALMLSRGVDLSELSKTIAVDAVMRPAGPEQAFHNLKTWAAGLLSRGRRSDAAAVLDGARRLSWELPEPHNDYGFCLLPDDPAGALAALDEATRLGYRRTVNVCNRILALHLLDRDADALGVAASMAANYENEETLPSMLWAPESVSGEPRLLEAANPRQYAIDLAVVIADRVGGGVAADWRALRARLSGGEPLAG